MHEHRPNPETNAVLRDLLTTWDEMEEITRDWIEAHGSRAVQPFARQLRRDFWAWYGGDEDGDLMIRLVRLALRRVDWRYVAERLLSKELRRQVRAEEEALTRLLLERGRRLPS